MLEKAPNRSPSEVGSRPSGVPGVWVPDWVAFCWFSRWRDVDSSIRRKFTVSNPFEDAGMIWINIRKYGGQCPISDSVKELSVKKE